MSKIVYFFSSKVFLGETPDSDISVSPVGNSPQSDNTQSYTPHTHVSNGHTHVSNGHTHVSNGHTHVSNDHVHASNEKISEGRKNQRFKRWITFALIFAAIGSTLLAVSGTWIKGLDGSLDFTTYLGQTFYYLSAGTIATLSGIILHLMSSHKVLINDLEGILQEARNATTTVEKFGSEVISIHNDLGEVSYISEYAGARLGVDAEELMGFGLFNRVHVLDRPLYLKTLADSVYKNKFMDIEVRILLGSLGLYDDSRGFCRVRLAINPVNTTAPQQVSTEQRSDRKLIVLMKNIEDEISLREKVLDLNEHKKELDAERENLLQKSRDTIHELNDEVVSSGLKQLLEKPGYQSFNHALQRVGELEDDFLKAAASKEIDEHLIEEVNVAQKLKAMTSRKLQSIKHNKSDIELKIDKGLNSIYSSASHVEAVLNDIIFAKDFTPRTASTITIHAENIGQNVLVHVERKLKYPRAEKVLNDKSMAMDQDDQEINVAFETLKDAQRVGKIIDAEIIIKHSLKRGLMVSLRLPHMVASEAGKQKTDTQSWQSEIAQIHQQSLSKSKKVAALDEYLQSHEASEEIDASDEINEVPEQSMEKQVSQIELARSIER